MSKMDLEMPNDERESASGLLRNSEVPEYWVNRMASGQLVNDSFDVLSYLEAATHDIFNELLESTYIAKVTQDRPCPQGLTEHALVKGGCACNQVDGTPGLPTGYKVRRVMRVEDAKMWQRYVRMRDTIRENRQELQPLKRLQPKVDTQDVIDRYPDVFQPLEDDLNEVYLWHGTFVRAALSIAADNFDVNLSGENRGTMYGKGLYLGESSTKADEYAKDEPGGYYEGAYVMMLCRVVLGEYFYTTERDENAGDHIESGEYDSTIGDRRASANTFREFVVYDADHVYPEYVVLYNRIFKDDDMEDWNRICKLPYHMELPVYWTNFHRDPRQESFDEHYAVQARTRKALQSLVLNSMRGNSKLERVRRVENSKVWLGYVDFKVSLKEKLHREAQEEASLETPASKEVDPLVIPPDDDYNYGGCILLCGCGFCCFWIPLVFWLGAQNISTDTCEWKHLGNFMKIVSIVTLVAQGAFLVGEHYFFKCGSSIGMNTRSCWRRRVIANVVPPITMLAICCWGLSQASRITVDNCRIADNRVNPVPAVIAITVILLVWFSLTGCCTFLIWLGDDGSGDTRGIGTVSALRKNLFQKEVRCVPAEEMDGDAEAGHVTTFQCLKELRVDGKIDEALWIENLENSLNENMLWHGTTKEAAEAIVHNDFRIPDNPKHGFRFGKGAYFAEDLDKSLSYAPNENGIQFVLLCRVTCGQYYYTESDFEGDAHEKAEAEHKTCVLANPEGAGPREFIVLSTNQVYPEFILEIST
mmetsp:Transcript_40382/g.77467  ORF Transcript_40382/g.77467 Transcript_40382/m.77467 type:complete len:759 (-) Transcript_40382:227-2503(-)